jgi:molybdopterin-guanine dinucleotide biosynthesis protein B
VEGYKRASIPKLEVYREVVGEGMLHPHDSNIVAVATDRTFDLHLPVLDLNRPDLVGDFILRHLGLPLPGATLASGSNK